jgi:hypothetical protein
MKGFIDVVNKITMKRGLGVLGVPKNLATRSIKDDIRAPVYVTSEQTLGSFIFVPKAETLAFLLCPGSYCFVHPENL